MKPEIERYIREHGDRYTDEALRRELIAAGHDPAEVDAALLERRRTATGGQTVGKVAFVFYIVGGLVGAAGAVLLALIGLSAGGIGPAALFVVLFAVVYLAIGYGIVRLARSIRASGWAAALLTIILVPVFGILVYGTCMAAYTISGAGAAPGG
jgi:hypothetical protein